MTTSADWLTLPASIRERLWNAYRAAKPEDWPTDEYTAARAEAAAFLADPDPHRYAPWMHEGADQ